MATTLSKGEKIATVLEGLDIAEGQILRAMKVARIDSEQRALKAALAYTRGAQTEVLAIKRGTKS